MSTLVSKVFSGVTIRTLGQALTIEDTTSPVPSVFVQVDTLKRTFTINGELIVTSFTFPTPLSIGNPPTLDPQALLQIYDNDATSDPQFVIQQGGTGDVAMRFNLSPYFGGRSFTMGIDNSEVNDPFKIAVSEALGTNDVFLLDDVASNIAIGLNALATVSGTNNIALGNSAGLALLGGSDNTLIASSAGLLLTTGSRNTCLGRISTGSSGDSLGAAFNDTILIGNDGSAVTTDGEIWIGNTTDHTSINIPVIVSLSSLTLGSPPVLFPGALLQIYDNDAGVEVQAGIEQDGTGDASFGFFLTGGQSYTMGIDNSAINDPFKISAFPMLGTNDLLSLDPSTGSSSLIVPGGAGGGDLTIESTAGSLILNGGEGAVDAVEINASSGGITISSGAGGIGSTSNGQIFFNSALSVINAIELTASGASGGIDMNTNTGGYDIRSAGGEFLVDTTGTGSSQITTVGAAGGTGDLTITTSAGSLNLNGGEAVSDAILVDATNAAGGVTIRYGTGGFTKKQPAPTTETIATTLLIAELLTQIIEATSPAGNQNYTLDTPANIVGAFDNPQVNDSFDFHIINLGIVAADTITIVPGGIATSVGNMVVTGAGATTDQSQGHFRIRLTNVGGGTEDYIVYRIG